MKVKAFIVDDEENSRSTLRNMLVDFCQDVEVLGEASTVQKAIQPINEFQPDLVFLDIIMPKENGFELLHYFDPPFFEVVFTTAYDQYAVKAFQLSAVDYLLKPIDLELLRGAVEKVKEKKSSDDQTKRINILEGNLTAAFEKISLPTADGFIFSEIDEIIRCEAQGNYTNIFFRDGNKILVSKTLKNFEDTLKDLYFFRINRSNLINLKEVKLVGRQRNPAIVLKDGTELLLSSNRKDEFFERMKGRG